MSLRRWTERSRCKNLEISLSGVCKDRSSSLKDAGRISSSLANPSWFVVGRNISSDIGPFGIRWVGDDLLVEAEVVVAGVRCTFG